MIDRLQNLNLHQTIGCQGQHYNGNILLASNLNPANAIKAEEAGAVGSGRPAESQRPLSAVRGPRVILGLFQPHLPQL